MGRKKKLENQAEAIVDAAVKLFGQYGYAKTTVDDIAREVGIGKATLYSDFLGKEDILLAVLDRLHREMLAAMETTIAKSKSVSALETLHKAVLKDFLFIIDAIWQHYSNIYGLKESIKALGKPYQEQRLVVDVRKRQMIASLLEKAAEAGEIIPTAEYETLAQLILTGMDGLISGQFERSRVENQKMASVLLEIFLSGLKLPRNSFLSASKEK